MRFTVIWSATALDELTDVWLQSQFRNDVTRASALIDQIFAFDTHLKGDCLLRRSFACGSASSCSIFN